MLDYNFDMDQRLNAIKTIYYLDIDMLAGGSPLFSGKEAKEQEQPEHQERGAGAGVGLSTLHFFQANGVCFSTTCYSYQMRK